MISFFAENGATVAASLIIIAVVALIIKQMYKDKKAGKSLCGGKCANCPGHCHGNFENENK